MCFSVYADYTMFFGLCQILKMMYFYKVAVLKTPAGRGFSEKRIIIFIMMRFLETKKGENIMKKQVFNLSKVGRVPSPRGRVRVRGKKAAFTLAEVLITLGIIGVVAAMTMPTLIKNYQQHETVNRLKETYSIISQAVRMSETENGLLESWEIPNTSWDANTYPYGKTFFEQYLKPYIKIAKECKFLSNECWADKYIRTNGVVDESYFSASNNQTYGMVLANGSVIGFYPRGSFCEIYIDLNGKKGPNKFGKDTFIIIIAKTSRNDTYGNFNKSGVYMYGQGKDSLLTAGNKSCSKNGNGDYCGALIMHDGWKISKEYPW